MMLSAKAALTHIAALSKEILALTQKIPAKNAHECSLQDQRERKHFPFAVAYFPYSSLSELQQVATRKIS